MENQMRGCGSQKMTNGWYNKVVLYYTSSQQRPAGGLTGGRFFRNYLK